VRASQRSQTRSALLYMRQLTLAAPRPAVYWRCPVLANLRRAAAPKKLTA